MLKKYDHKFEELFDSKRQAVVCYLGLEDRYSDLLIRHQKLNKEYNELKKNPNKAGER